MPLLIVQLDRSFFYVDVWTWERKESTIAFPILVCFLHSQINTRNNCASHARIAPLIITIIGIERVLRISDDMI